MVASVVLNGATSSSTRVSETTRLRVLETAARIQYRRNAVASGLLNRRMHTIGVAMVMEKNEVNLYFLEMLNGLLDHAREWGQNTTILSLSSWEEDDRILQFCDGRVDGVVFIAPNNLHPELVDSIQKYNPAIMVHGSIEAPRLVNIDIDNEQGGYLITRHLIELGHRRVACFPGGEHLLGARQRTIGYRKALEEAGLEYTDELVLPGQFNVSTGRVRVLELLSCFGRGSLPTAIVCGNDNIAYGCMEALAEQELSVPQEISVTGFDDTLLARVASPRLTTIRQPFYRMGMRAVDLLLSQIENSPLPAKEDDTWIISNSSPENNTTSHTEMFPVELVVRDSSAPLGGSSKCVRA